MGTHCVTAYYVYYVAIRRLIHNFESPPLSAPQLTMTESSAEPPATLTFGTSLAKFDVLLESYLASFRSEFSSFPTPLYGVAAGAVIFSKHHPAGSNPRILLVQRSATDSMPLRWEIPGGAVDPGETILAAVAREVREETGLAVTSIRGLVAHEDEKSVGVDGGFFFRTTRGKTIVKFTFVVEVQDSEKVRLDPDEHQDYVWATELECRAKRVVREKDAGIETKAGAKGTVDLDFTTAGQEAAILRAFALRRSDDSEWEDTAS